MHGTTMKIMSQLFTASDCIRHTHNVMTEVTWNATR